MKKKSFIGKTEAFTIIEFVVILAIIAVMMGIAIPAFSVWRADAGLRRAATDLYSEMQSARMKAIKNHGEWALVFNAGAGTYQVMNGGPDGDYSTPGDNTVEKTIILSQYGSGVNYGHGTATVAIGGGGFDNDITFSADTVVFNSQGMIKGSTGGYVYVQNPNNKTYAVGAPATGVIRLKKWNGSAWDYEGSEDTRYAGKEFMESRIHPY